MSKFDAKKVNDQKNLVDYISKKFHEKFKWPMKNGKLFTFHWISYHKLNFQTMITPRRTGVNV